MVWDVGPYTTYPQPLASPSLTPPNGYVAENGTTFYVAEDGVTFYVQEH